MTRLTIRPATVEGVDSVLAIWRAADSVPTATDDPDHVGALIARGDEQPALHKSTRIAERIAPAMARQSGRGGRGGHEDKKKKKPKKDKLAAQETVQFRHHAVTVEPAPAPAPPESNPAE